MSIYNFNTIFVYNENDPDSLDIALQYQNIHDLDVNHLIPINCSSNEILADYSTFQSEVETPILTAMSGLTNIYVIVLGYNVPGGFYDGLDIISATSRLSRINHAYSKQEKNALFDRKVFRGYNEELDSSDTLDSDKAIICSRIDGPNKDFVENILFRSKCAFNTNEVNGRFYLDPYSDLNGTLADQYQSKLTNFQSNILPSLNLENCITFFIDPYVDSIHHQLVEDSFYWGWFTDRGSGDYFRSTDTTRLFFYNADYDGAESIRYSAPERWPQLALGNGYVSTAGAMSNPGIDGFLQPEPFFVALREQATLGEAMLFSMPYFNWTISFFGDPLLRFVFPATYQEELFENRDIPSVTNRELLISILLEDFARLVAYGLYRDSKQEDVRETIALSTDILLEVKTLTLAHLMVITPDFYDNLISDLSDKINLYLLERVVKDVKIEESLELQDMDDIQDYLSYFSIKISEIISDYLDVSDSTLFYSSGLWSVELPIQEESVNFEEFHFEIQVSSDENFATILHTIDSELDQTNWTYEENENNFSGLPVEGVGSNFVNRKIRYESKASEFLTSSEIYYFRLRQKSSLGTYGYREFEDIIWT